MRGVCQVEDGHFLMSEPVDNNGLFDFMAPNLIKIKLGACYGGIRLLLFLPSEICG